MTTEWFNKRPGKPAVQVQPDGSYATLLPITVPSVVRLPAELGGSITNVLYVDKRECPRCEGVHERWHLDAAVEGDDGNHVTVIECPAFGQFLWGYAPS
jgi:hypothetical protein